MGPREIKKIQNNSSNPTGIVRCEKSTLTIKSHLCSMLTMIKFLLCIQLNMNFKGNIYCKYYMKQFSLDKFENKNENS